MYVDHVLATQMIMIMSVVFNISCHKHAKFVKSKDWGLEKEDSLR